MDRLGMTDGELEARLEAYADARLSPDPDWTASTRAQLVALAERHADAQARERATRRGRAARPDRRPVLGSLRRRLAAGAVAAALTVGSAAAVLAADAASPLYPARLFLEGITAPSDAAADLVRMDQRLQEARSAAQSGQGANVSAALDAYRQTLSDALRAAGSDADRLARLQVALGVHDVVLSELGKTAPDNAKQAVEKAVSANHEAAGASGRPTPSPEPLPSQAP
jgi:hypothetical protein